MDGVTGADEYTGNATTSLVLGIMSFFLVMFLPFFCPPTVIVTVVMSGMGALIGQRALQTMPPGHHDHSVAFLGLVMSGVSGLLGVLVGIVFCGVMGLYGLVIVAALAGA